jgi:hypothetical protein
LTIELAGATAIGVVYGWWSAPLIDTSTHRRTPAALIAAAGTAVAEALSFGGAWVALAWLIGATVGLTGHALFRARLADYVARTEGEFV